MNWQDFTLYLQDKIIQLKENTTSKERELTPFAKEKYCSLLSEESINDLEANLEYLLLSYQEFDLDGNYHRLPDIEKEIEESEEEQESDDESNIGNNYSFFSQKKNLKSWTEIFPTRKTCLLGESCYEAVSWETYNLLGRIYEDWKNMGEKAHDLTQKAEKWEEQFKKTLEEWADVKTARELLKEKGLKEKLKTWLTDYENLESEQQKLLEEKYEEIKKMMENMEKAETDLFKKEQQEKGWLRNLDWKSIAIFTGIGAILILLVLIIRKYFIN